MGCAACGTAHTYSLALSPGHIASPRATARVPTPLYTTPALTMIHGESRSLRPHCKGGGGVERGGDPCGRPGGRESVCVTLPARPQPTPTPYPRRTAGGSEESSSRETCIVTYIFSSFAKSMLRRFLPCLPWNWTSTNSVPRSISLLRMMPSPNLS